MPFDPERNHRRSVRLRGQDYASAGAYFVTMCTRDRAFLFGNVVDGEMLLNDAGCAAQEEWLRTGDLRPYATIDEFVVMPNHIHGIIVLHEPDSERVACIAPTRPDPPLKGRAQVERFGQPTIGSIPTIVRAFKAATTKRVNCARRSTPCRVPTVWQRNYYEHIIRTSDELRRVRRYIAANPAQWELDRENPESANREPSSA